jgi:hypothetical protein
VLTTDVRDRFAGLEQKQSPEEYNYEHFRTRHLMYDARATVEKLGIQPGELAPDFELPAANGATVRLSDLRARPVLLHFGSPT